MDKSAGEATTGINRTVTLHRLPDAYL